MLAKRWKAILLILAYFGVAVGGYVYFAAQNPLTQLSKVTTQERFGEVQTDLSTYLFESVKGYLYYEQEPQSFPDQLGVFPLSDEVQKQGDKVLQELIASLDDLEEELPEDWPQVDSSFSTSVSENGYSQNRVRILPKTQAGVAVSVSVDREFRSEYEDYGLYSTGIGLEIAVVIDGPSQKIVSVVNSASESW